MFVVTQGIKAAIENMFVFGDLTGDFFSRGRIEMNDFRRTTDLQAAVLSEDPLCLAENLEVARQEESIQDVTVRPPSGEE